MGNLKRFILFLLFICNLAYAQPPGGAPAPLFEEKDGSPSLRSRKVIIANDVLSQDTNVSNRIELLLVSPTSADTSYVRLDASNDPITGALDFLQSSVSGNEINLQATTAVSAVSFVGSGNDDMTASGTFNNTTDIYYRVKIDTVGGSPPETYAWSDDDGETWDATEQIINVAVPTLLNNGVYITFASDNTHELNDEWSFTAYTYSGKFINFKNVSGTTIGYVDDEDIVLDTMDFIVDSDSQYNYWGEAQDAYRIFDGNSLNDVANSVTSTDDYELTTDYAKFFAGSDTDDFIEIFTATDQPTLNWNGCDGKITASGGTIGFDNENLTTTGWGRFDGGLAIGQAITAGENISITMSATDISAISVDGTTNDYTGTGNGYDFVWDLGRDVNAGNGNEPTNFYGEIIDLRLKHTSAQLANNSKTERGLSAGITDTSVWTTSSSATRFLNMSGIYGTLNLSGTFNTTSTGGLVPFLYGVAGDVDVTNTLTASSTGAHSLTTYGLYSDVDVTPTLSSGTLTALTHGLYVDVAGNTAGSHTAYGIKINNVSGADGGYGLYIGTITTGWGFAIFDDSGVDWLLDSDTGEIYWGEAQDASIGFDADSMNIKANLVTATDDLEIDAGDILFKTDCGISQASPHLTFRDSDTNAAYEWHLDTAAAQAPYQGYTLWEGTDADGKSFAREAGRPPIFHYDGTDIKFYLSDAAGANYFNLYDKAGTPVIEINSLGDMIVGGSFQVETGKFIISPTTAYVIDAVGDTIPLTEATVILNPNGNYTLTSAPTIADGSIIGQMMWIIMDNAEANTVAVQDQDTLANSNLQLGTASRTISARDVLHLMWDGTDWIEVNWAAN